jgi:hypothetical protein
MALAMVPAGSSRPIEKIVPGPLCFDAHFGAPLPPAPGAAAPPRPPPPRYATGRTKKVLEIKVVGYHDSNSGVPSVVTSDDL